MKIRKLFTVVLVGLTMLFSSCSKKSGPYKNSRNYSYDSINSKGLLTQEEFDRDLDALEHLFKNAYVLYDKSVKKRFIMKAFLKEIRKECPVNADGFYKRSELQKAILKNCARHLPYADSHLYMGLGNNFRNVFGYHVVFFSDVYFEKKGKDYFVVSSSDESIKAGSKYKGKKENLYKCLTSSGELYRFGVMSDCSIETAELSLDSGKFTVGLSFENKMMAQRDTSKVSESEKLLYIKVSDWAFGFDYETEAMTKARALLDEIKEASKNAFEKDYVIVDLRGNPGGISNYGEEVLNYLYFANEPKLIGPFTNNLKNARKRQIMLMSSEIAYAGSRYNNLGLTASYDPDLYPREYKGIEEKACKEFPSYKGEKKFKGKLIILTDCNSASASEYFVAMARLIDEDNVILVGENTKGCISYGGVLRYYLPESGIILNLSSVDLSESALFAKNEKWAGETYGFMPDYWATNDMLPETLEVLTGSNVINELME